MKIGKKKMRTKYQGNINKSLLFIIFSIITFGTIYFIILPHKLFSIASVTIGSDPETGDFVVKIGGVVKLRVDNLGMLTVATLNGTINAANVASGQFGNKSGGGNYTFPSRVGIGTTNPATALDVAGSIKADNILNPITATIWLDEFDILTGSFSYTPSLTQLYGGFWESNSTLGASLEGKFYLKAGSFTMYVLGATNKYRGKIDWYIDDVLVVVGQDWYSTSTANNIVKTAAVAITFDGIHTLKGVVSGKNDSSLSYLISLTKIWFK